MRRQADAQQQDLPVRIVRPRLPLDMVLAELTTTSSLGQAIGKCAGLMKTPGKTVAIEMGIDEATWTKIQKDAAGVSGEFLSALQDAYGNDLPLFFQLQQRGWDPKSVRRFENDLERENRELREKVAFQDRVIDEIVRHRGGERS